MEVDDELRTIISEQHRELKAAKEIESDLHFAFQLQMQETINASLSLQPSYCSSSSSTSRQFHIANDDESNSSFAHLISEEIERFEQEFSDRDQAEAHAKRMRYDLNRHIHDQVFARDLLNVRQEEWNRTGDYYQRPYGEGSSSLASKTNNAESFRLYFKGLVREETVGNVKKVLAGIGVAICDATDGLIFELRKRLIADEASDEVAEVKALIEGLNAAVTLGLKRVTVICDNNLLYRYVIGKWHPTQSNLATLVDEVTLLQRNFTNCNPSLVERKDIKFAYKLARDAIVSQVTQPTERSGRNLTETCVICFEDTDIGQMLFLNGCMHRYCFTCMKRHMEVKLLQGLLPKCPHQGCKSELKIEGCKKFLTPELFNIMSQLVKEASIPVTDKIYCPYPRCSALMSKAEVHGSATGARRCTKCRGLFCINCKVPWHSNMICFDYKRLNPYPCAEDAKLKSLATTKLWRQCVKCKHMVELAEGCYHIYCRCGHEFCYTCGAEWKNKKATCTCLIWNEHNIIYDERERNRRQQRRG